MRSFLESEVEAVVRRSCAGKRSCGKSGYPFRIDHHHRLPETGPDSGSKPGSSESADGRVSGVVSVDSEEELSRKVTGTLVDNIIRVFTKEVLQAARSQEPEPDQVVFRGTLDEVQEFFLRRQWTDGLPVIPRQSTGSKSFFNLRTGPGTK